MGTLVVRGPEIPNLVARVTYNKIEVFDDRTTNFRIYERLQTGLSYKINKDPSLDNYIYESIWNNPGEKMVDSVEDYILETITFTNE